MLSGIGSFPFANDSAELHDTHWQNEQRQNYRKYRCAFIYLALSAPKIHILYVPVGYK